MGTRWLGAGLAAALAVVTLGLALTDRLALYINPDQAWFAIGMAILALVGAAASFALPLGAEDEHGHDHGDDHDHDHEPAGGLPVSTRFARSTNEWAGRIAATAGGLVASAVVVAALILPPAPLSVELAMSRDTGAPPLFAGADEVLLAGADTTSFGVGQWATVFATAADPDAYVGTEIDLTGFVTPGDDGALRLGRLVVTHCVIDAQPASLSVVSPGWEDSLAQGDWIRIQGTIVADASGALVIEPTDLTSVDVPDDPYEY